jgi:hypothetical protein
MGVLPVIFVQTLNDALARMLARLLQQFIERLLSDRLNRSVAHSCVRGNQSACVAAGETLWQDSKQSMLWITNPRNLDRLRYAQRETVAEIGDLRYRALMQHSLPAAIEEYRDEHWHREGTARVERAPEGERFIEQAGFINCLTDARKPGPSLYIAVCGRRDAVMPHNVQKDPEASHTWLLKDELVRRGKVYYGKLTKARTMFLAPRVIPFFNAIWGVPKSQEKKRLSSNALTVLKVLRKEWEMATSDLRAETGISDRKALTQALDELQAALIVVPSEVVYQPKFTYIWTLAEGRFPEQLAEKVDRVTAVREIARCFLQGAGMTVPGELARVTGIPRPEAGLGNRALVKEGFAVSPAQGTYVLASLNL